MFVCNQRAGALAGYSWGHGVLVARLPGGWSAPLLLRQRSGSLGLLLGWQRIEACHVLQVCRGRGLGVQVKQKHMRMMLHAPSGGSVWLRCVSHLRCCAPFHPTLPVPCAPLLLQTDEQVQAFTANHAHGMELGAEGADPDAAQLSK